MFGRSVPRGERAVAWLTVVGRLTLVALVMSTAGCAPARAPRDTSGSLRPVRAADVLKVVGEPGAKAVVVNMWATWCEPCREEFPDLLRLERTYRDRGLRLVLVSADFESELPAVRGFLRQQGVNFATYYKVGDDMAFINGLEPRWSGALPATFVYDGDGSLRRFWEGKASFDSLEQRVHDVLGTPAEATSKGGES